MNVRHISETSIPIILAPFLGIHIFIFLQTIFSSFQWLLTPLLIAWLFLVDINKYYKKIF